jgi:hypothetical protein
MENSLALYPTKDLSERQTAISLYSEAVDDKNGDCIL